PPQEIWLSYTFVSKGIRSGVQLPLSSRVSQLKEAIINSISDRLPSCRPSDLTLSTAPFESSNDIAILDNSQIIENFMDMLEENRVYVYTPFGNAEPAQLEFNANMWHSNIESKVDQIQLQDVATRPSISGKSVGKGFENFLEFKKQDYFFLDKSIYCKKLFDDGDIASLILRPRQFGKSMLLSMIEYFFQTPRPDEDLTLRFNIFKDLKISGEKEFFKECFAKFPVIHVSLNGLSSDSYEDMLCSFADTIKDVYESYHYIKPELDQSAFNLFERITNGNSSRTDLI
ncbi:4458_t:CDS:2, partial [Paraglomus occultum]